MTIEKIRKEHELIDLFCNLAEVPSPSMHEEKVAEWIKNYCDKNDLNCSFSYVDSQSDKYNASVDTDLIGSQNPPAGTLLRGVSSPHFYINGEVLND